MRLPNGYGSVVKLSGNRRKPFLVKKTVGYDLNKKPITTVLGYCATKEDGLQLLAEYNKDFSILEGMNLKKVYRAWLPSHKKSVSDSTLEGYKNQLNHLSSISSMPIKKIKYKHLQDIIDKMRNVQKLSYSSCKKVRSLINMLFSYAVANEWIDRMPYAKHLELGKNNPTNPHVPFTRKEIIAVWNSQTTSDIALILLYTGMRSKELRELNKRDVDLEDGTFFIRTSKTTSGIRTVPIHSKIMPIVKRLMKEPGEYLLGEKVMSYAQLSKQFKKTMADAKLDHTTHDCRHTVATLLNEADGNPNAIRAILGHADGDITTRVYTHVSLSLLHRTIALLS